jgi:hypothetical protein
MKKMKLEELVPGQREEPGLAEALLGGLLQVEHIPSVALAVHVAWNTDLYSTSREPAADVAVAARTSDSHTLAAAPAERVRTAAAERMHCRSSVQVGRLWIHTKVVAA